MRKLILIAACAFAAAALPAFAGAGAFHGSETFTETFSMFGPDPCVDKFVTGIATQSGVATFVDPPSGGTHVRVDFSGSVDLYEATDLDPNGPTAGSLRRHVDVRGRTSATRLRRASRAPSPA